MKRIRLWAIPAAVTIAVLLPASPVVFACPDDNIKEVRGARFTYNIEVASLALIAKSAGALQSESNCIEGDQRPECAGYIKERAQLTDAFASLENVVNNYAVAVAVANGCGWAELRP